jgi:GDP-D-mannose dehydratase
MREVAPITGLTGRSGAYLAEETGIDLHNGITLAYQSYLERDN